MAEKIVKYYQESGEPVVFEWSPDGVLWYPVEHYDEAPATGCKQAVVDVESGWVRSKTLFNNPELYQSEGNAIAVPEPGWVGLALGALLLVRWGRKRSAC